MKKTIRFALLAAIMIIISVLLVSCDILYELQELNKTVNVTVNKNEESQDSTSSEIPKQTDPEPGETKPGTNTPESNETKPQEPQTHIHKFDDWVTIRKVSCTESGLKERFCDCGERQTQEIEPNGHSSYTNSRISKEATCTEEGIVEYTCSACAAVVKTEAIAAKGHSYSYENVSASCETPGGKKYTCRGCNDSYFEETTEPIGHNIKISGICSRCSQDFSIDMNTRISAPVLQPFNKKIDISISNGAMFLKWETINISNKSIKYISFELVAYNAVGDSIWNNVYKLEGPYAPNDKIIYDSKLIVLLSPNPLKFRELCLKNIKIEYTDGSVECGSYNHNSDVFGGKFVRYNSEYFEFFGTNQVIFYESSNSTVYYGTYTVEGSKLTLNFNSPNCPYNGTFTFTFEDNAGLDLVLNNDYKFGLRGGTYKYTDFD